MGAVVVGDGRSAELNGAVVGLHEFLVDGDGLTGREVGLGWVVGFVGAVGCWISGGGQRVCVGSTCANRALVPPSIKTGTRSFQLLFSSAASTYAGQGVSIVLPGQKPEC